MQKIPPFDLECKDEENVKNLLLYIKSHQGYGSMAYIGKQVISRQVTRFERMSADLQIGVQTTSKRFGVCLLQVLKCQIDCTPISDVFQCLANEKFENPSWEFIIDKMVEHHGQHVDEFDIGGRATRTLRKISMDLEIKHNTRKIPLWRAYDLLEFVKSVS